MIFVVYKNKIKDKTAADKTIDTCRTASTDCKY